jgi:putative hydrolase of the HAD superfamily
MPPIEAVLIDVGGVLDLPDHERIVAALARVGVTVDAANLDRAHYEGVAALEEFTEGDRSVWAAYQRAYARACGAPDDRLDEIVEALHNEFTTGGIWTRIVPGSRGGLAALADLGVQLAIVSNSDGSVEAQLRENEICQVGPGPGVPVGAVIDSSVVGVSKPDPRIFELALEALDVPAECAMHVGDTPGADVDGARAAGVHPVLLDPFELHTDLDVERVASLGDVVALVRSGQPA